MRDVHSHWSLNPVVLTSGFFCVLFLMCDLLLPKCPLPFVLLQPVGSLGSRAVNHAALRSIDARVQTPALLTVTSGAESGGKGSTPQSWGEGK